MLARTFLFNCIIAAVTREHGGWEQVHLQTSGARNRADCLIPARQARRDKVLDEVGAASGREHGDHQEPALLAIQCSALFGG